MYSSIFVLGAKHKSGHYHFDDIGFRLRQMSSVRSVSDGGKPRQDARRGRCHPLEAGFWPLWMTPLPRTNITEY